MPEIPREIRLLPERLARSFAIFASCFSLCVCEGIYVGALSRATHPSTRKEESNVCDLVGICGTHEANRERAAALRKIRPFVDLYKTLCVMRFLRYVYSRGFACHVSPWIVGRYTMIYTQLRISNFFYRRDIVLHKFMTSFFIIFQKVRYFYFCTDHPAPRLFFQILGLQMQSTL